MEKKTERTKIALTDGTNIFSEEQFSVIVSSMRETGLIIVKGTSYSPRQNRMDKQEFFINLVSISYIHNLES